MATKVSTVEPVFIKDSDMPLSDLTPYTVVQAVIQTVSAQYVEGVQKIGSLWRIYLNSVHSRLDFISKKTVVIPGKVVPLYEQNPFKTHQKTPKEIKDKLTVRGLPLSVSNQEIQTLLESKGVVLASSIKYSQIRNEDGTLTKFLNGDRFLYCEPLSTPLPRQQTVCNFQCLVYHHGMNNNQCKSCNTLNEELYREGIHDIIQETFLEYLDMHQIEKSMIWELLKIRVKEFSIKYCSVRKQKHASNIRMWESKIKLIDREIESVKDNNELTEERKSLKDQLDALYMDVAIGAQICSKVKFVEKGERFFSS